VNPAVEDRDLVEPDERQHRVNPFLIGQTRSRKVPHRTKQSRGNVESAVALGKAGSCVIDYGRRFVVDLDATAGRRNRVDPRQVAIGPIAGIPRLDSPDFGLGGCRYPLKTFSRFSAEVKAQSDAIA
jgi:hypothetical protein